MASGDIPLGVLCRNYCGCVAPSARQSSMMIFGMVNSKARCLFCREYFPAGEMIVTGVGKLCSQDCFGSLQDKYKDKNSRRIASKRSSQKPRSSKKRTGIPAGVRQAVKERDRNRCRRCGNPNGVQLHHVEYLSQGGPDEVTNILSLCLRCHSLAHSNPLDWQPILLMMLSDQRKNMTVEQAKRKLKAFGDS